MNLLLPLPLAQVDVETFIIALQELDGVDRELAYNARLQVTVQAIRLVAILQDQGVVHGRIRPGAFHLMNGGSVHLGDSESMVKAGAKSEPMLDWNWNFAAPETSVTRRFFGYPKVRYTHAMDAWGLGATLFWIWCNTYPNTGSGSFYSIENLFHTCGGAPEPVKILVYRFLNNLPRRRELALQPMETSQYKAMVHELSDAVTRY